MLIKFSVFTRQKAVIFIAYLSLFLSSISNADSEIIITNDLKEVNQKYQELYENYPPETILIIFSIKKVLFKSLFPSFAKLDNNTKSDLSIIFKSLKEGRTSYFDTIMLTEYKNQLVDDNLPNYLKDIMDKGSPVIAIDNGLTGNFNNIKNLEVWKADYLKSFNIDLSNSFPKYNYLIFNNIDSFENTYPVFYKGILSSNDGSVYQLILNFLIKVNYLPKVLIMIDSDLNELKSTETQLKNYNDNIMFIGYHYDLSEQNHLEISSYNVKKLFKDLVDKANLVKRNNPKIKVPNRENVNPYDKK